MKLTCTVSRLANGKWLARHTGPSTGRVGVTAPTREGALTKMRNELQYGSSGARAAGPRGIPTSFRCGRKEEGHEQR